VRSKRDLDELLVNFEKAHKELTTGKEDKAFEVAVNE